jgi:hypothetical protein
MSRIKRSSEFVTVACKLPQGLNIALAGQVHPVKLHGSNSPFARFGYGMTDISVSTWEQILVEYGDRDGTDRNGKPCRVPQAAWLTNKVVFAASQTESVNAEAKERENAVVGFEPVDPRKLDKAGAAGTIHSEGSPDFGMPGYGG